jgi:SIR2-like domain
MLNDTLSLPGNGAVFDELTDRIGRRRAIAFVGAGASADLYPMWNECIRTLAELAVRERKVDAEVARYWLTDPALSPQQRVESIAHRLGERTYREFLRTTFAEKKGSNGKRYTRVHELLMSLPFRGYVTTNYDPALDFARGEIRSHCRTTGTPTWRDDAVVNDWLTGDIFDESDACPILWVHGFSELPETIVLNAGEYSTAYSRRVYQGMFRRLWQQDRLVFVGFGFADPRFTFMVSEILEQVRDAAAAPRHIALIAVDPSDNLAVLEERRLRMVADYGIDPLFYGAPTRSDRSQDHSRLIEILETLSKRCGTAAAPREASPPIAETSVEELWVHETTNDALFIGRSDERTQLNRWVRDPAIRVIGVSAVGGTGKTALVGQWLRQTDGWLTRPFNGVFAWSFYRDRDSTEFVKSFANWATRSLGLHDLDPGSPMKSAISAIRRRQLVVLLDGLELLQEGPNEVRYGSFLDPLLREFLTTACHSTHGSVIVLTSRFRFADLDRFLGTSFHQLDLTGLDDDQGAAHLADLGVSATDHERARVSDYLSGHPLALRVFAEALPDPQKETPFDFLSGTFNAANLSRSSPLVDKIKHLLTFYEQRLPRQEVRLLSVVALFHAPVSESVIVRLTRSVMVEESAFPLPSDSVLGADLQRLVSRGILMQEVDALGRGYIAHPILRDYFRETFFRADARTSLLAANLLTEQPSRHLNANGAELLIAAMDVLVGSGHLYEANDLYRGRLSDGRAFMDLGAPLLGLRAAMVFVSHENRRAACQKILTRGRLAYYLNEVGLCAWLTGQYDLAARFYADSNAIDRELVGRDGEIPASLGSGLRNEAHVMVCIGRLEEALRLAKSTLDAHEYSPSMRWDHDSKGKALVLTGWIRMLMGDIHNAVNEFVAADPDVARGVRWCEALVRGGLARQAQIASTRYLAYSDSFEVTARYQWVLALCAIELKDSKAVELHIKIAEEHCRSGQLLFDLARVHVTAARSALLRDDPRAAEQQIAEALALAQPRNMKLVLADALAVRGRIRVRLARDRDQLASALDDAEEALRIGRESQYAWAERDALFLQADVYTLLARKESRFTAMAAAAESTGTKLAKRLGIGESEIHAAAQGRSRRPKLLDFLK